MLPPPSRDVTQELIWRLGKGHFNQHSVSVMNVDQSHDDSSCYRNATLLSYHRFCQFRQPTVFFLQYFQLLNRLLVNTDA